MLDIKKALKDNSNDSYLIDALLLTRQKELQLLNQVAKQGQGTI